MQHVEQIGKLKRPRITVECSSGNKTGKRPHWKVTLSVLGCAKMVGSRYCGKRSIVGCFRSIAQLKRVELGCTLYIFLTALSYCNDAECSDFVPSAGGLDYKRPMLSSDWYWNNIIRYATGCISVKYTPNKKGEDYGLVVSQSRPILPSFTPGTPKSNSNAVRSYRWNNLHFRRMSDVWMRKAIRLLYRNDAILTISNF